MIYRPFSTAMIDMLLCTVIAMFIAIAPPRADKGVEALADYQLTMRWQRDLNIDIDRYLMAPDGKVIWYSNKHEGNINIDRDDLGTVNDTSDNVETIFIREPKDGRYFVSLQSYGPSGMVPVGTIIVAVQDRHGVQPFPPGIVDMPPFKVEVPIFYFDIKEGKIIGSGVSTVKIREGNRAIMDSNERGTR